MNANAAVFVPNTIKGASPPKSGATSGVSGSNTSSSPGSGTDRAFHLLQANKYVEKSPLQRSDRGSLKGTANARTHNPSPRGTNGPQQRGSRSSQRRNNSLGASKPTFPFGMQHDDEYAASIQHTEINNQGEVNSDETPKSSFVELTPNKRGQISLNHLLNFSFPERQRPTSEFRQPARKKANYVPYDRERFVNANFRFLVKAIRDFKVYLSDPDFVIDWSDIDQVLITTTNPPSCPICLQLPMSARVTKCGHTFCLSCILHYLALSEDKKTWRKCPICWDSIYAKDLKSVRFWEVASIKPSGEESPASSSEGNITDGQKLEFRLMQREADSMLAFPESAYWPQRRGNVSVPWHFTPDAMTFAKFMMSTPGYMTSELQHDLDQLTTSLKEARNWNEEAEIPFLEMAIGNVEEEIEVVLREGAENAVIEGERKAREQIVKAEKAAEKAAEKKEQERAEKIDEMMIAGKVPEFLKHPYAGVLEENTSQPSTTTTATTAPTSRISTQSSKGGDSSYFFYQSHDGQNIYLHPLDIRILKHEFGSYADFPRTLTSPVVAISESTLTADLRKRFKYLSHLPLSCDVTFVELELSGIVGETTMCAFSNELRSRISKREEKVRKEEKARREAEERERRELESVTGGKQARLTRLEQELILREDPFFQVSVSSSSSFDVDEVISHGDFSSESDERDHRFSEGSVGSGDNNNHDVFAASLSEPPRESTSSSKKTMWGTPSVSFANVAANKQKPNSWGGKWSTFHDYDLEDEDYDDWGEAHEVVNKKGKKKLVLMSTGGRRGG